MGVIGWVVMGLLAGWLAKVATGYRRSGCLFTMAVGILGGLIGGLLFNLVGEEGVTDFDVWSLIVSFVGASLLLLVLGAFTGRGRRR
jgi:uncharacterized membrane protein YeaQ/YmgE (transglycosylase-associated protein family)